MLIDRLSDNKSSEITTVPYYVNGRPVIGANPACATVAAAGVVRPWWARSEERAGVARAALDNEPPLHDDVTQYNNSCEIGTRRLAVCLIGNCSAPRSSRPLTSIEAGR